MLFLSHSFVRAAALLGLGAFVAFGLPPTFAQTLTNVTVRVMAANLTSGSSQRYETPGLNILKGLRPDIVALQEFNVSNQFGINTTLALSNMVAAAFGTNFVYFRESNAGYTIPNGVISRYPFVASGSWVDHDTGVNDRGFAWVQIDLPGSNDLYVVSVHLKASNSSGPPSDASRRAAQAAELKALISTNFPADAWVIIAGDMNIYSESEGAVTTFKTFLSDSPVPADQNGDSDTNAGRTERYDRVLPSFSLTNLLTIVQMPSRAYASGLVFDSRVYTPLSDVPPVMATDSAAANMQHMGVVKDFLVPYTVTSPTVLPIITAQPQSLTVNQSESAVFSVVATGTPAPTYQWRFNGTNLAGAIASSYTRTNAQPVHMGEYSVVVSNSAGGVTSTNAALRLNVPAPLLSLSTAGGLQWQGLSNLTYTIQSRTNLNLGTWQTLGSASAPDGMLVVPLVDTNAPQLFFRVVYP